MSRIEELESERENLHLEQLKLQNKAKICEVRQLEISNEIRELKIEDDKEAIHGFALKLTIQESNFRNFVIKFLAKQTCMLM